MRTVGLHTGWLNFFDFLFLHKVEMNPSIPANVWFTKDSCHMGNFGCGDGGWTLAMKIDGTQVNSLPPLRNSRYHWIEHRQIKDVILVFQRTFHYDSHFWSNRNGYNFAGDKTGFDSQETKLPTYWNTPFSKICLGMKTGHQLRFIVINRHANSLFSLIADGKYRATSLGRNTWKWLIGSRASLQPNCKRKDSIQWEATLVIPKQESASLLTSRITVVPVTPELVLAQEVYLMILTRVEMRQCTRQIVDTSTSKLWITSWYSDRGHS